MLSCARDPETLLRPSCTADVVTVSEITLHRHLNIEPTAEAVFANPDRRHRWDEDDEAIPHLSLPAGAIWVTAAASSVDLGHYRMATMDPGSRAGAEDMRTPVLELWLSPASRAPGSGLRLAVVTSAGRTPAEIERTIARHLADETVVGVQMRDDDPAFGVSRIALKVEAVELLCKHGLAHMRVADDVISTKQLDSCLHRFTMFINTFEAWTKQLKRFFSSMGVPISAVTGIIVLLVGLLAALHKLGVI